MKFGIIDVGGGHRVRHCARQHRGHVSTLTKDKQSLEAMYRKGWQDAEKLVQWYRAAKAEA